jgi:hypothetical protein
MGYSWVTRGRHGLIGASVNDLGVPGFPVTGMLMAREPAPGSRSAGLSASRGWQAVDKDGEPGSGCAGSQAAMVAASSAPHIQAMFTWGYPEGR